MLFPVSEFQIISDSGTAFLSQLPANKNIYFREVESGEYSLVNPDLINLDTGEINGMKEDSNIDFLYYVNSSSSLQYTFDKKRLEYVTIEIINQGNSSNRGSKMYLKIGYAFFKKILQIYCLFSALNEIMLSGIEIMKVSTSAIGCDS